MKDEIQKNVSQKKHPRKNFPKTRVYTNDLIFLKLSRLQKLHFPLKDSIDDSQ